MKPRAPKTRPAKTPAAPIAPRPQPEPAPLAADPARMEIFLVATPGLEEPLAEEVRALGWDAQVQPGGVTFAGGWPDVWRANLEIRVASPSRFAGLGSWPAG